MHRCLQFAKLGAGNVAPNPMVGAVLVHDDIIIGEGYHQQYGQAHAEVNCINSVAEENKGLVEKSTLFVSLEPCAHFGKTPPCADLIVANKIPKVVIACRDSYTEVNGKGIQLLKAAGVEVVTGILENEAKELNRRFFTFHEKGRPYIILKWAQSSDHKISNADYSSVMISNEYSNRLVHQWRSEEAAIMVGTNTALYDNPSLTNRHWTGSNPVRVLLDMSLKVPATHKLLSGEVKTIIFNAVKNEATGNNIFCKVDVAGNVIAQVLQQLHQMKMQSVLVEGGAQLLQSFIDAGSWDEARMITNESLVIGDGIAAPVLRDHHLINKVADFSDHIYYYNHSL